MRPPDAELKAALIEYEQQEEQESIEFEAMVDLLHLRIAVRIERKAYKEVGKPLQSNYPDYLAARAEVDRLVDSGK